MIKVCPLVEARGIKLNERIYKKAKKHATEADDCWLKVCIAECPLDDCIFEYPSGIKKEDKQTFADYLSTMQ